MPHFATVFTYVHTAVLSSFRASARVLPLHPSNVSFPSSSFAADSSRSLEICVAGTLIPRPSRATFHPIIVVSGPAINGAKVISPLPGAAPANVPELRLPPRLYPRLLITRWPASLYYPRIGVFASRGRKARARVARRGASESSERQR